MAAQRWSDLSERTRRLIIAAGVIEGSLKLAALADMRRRPAGQVRGKKWIWAPVVLAVNSFGLAPLDTFAWVGGLSSAPNIARAARILVSSVAGMPGSRNIVMVYQSGAAPPTTAECHEIAQVARSARTRIHAIVPESVPALTDLCAKTGGFVVERPLEELPHSLEGLYANLVSHYQIRLRCDRPAAALKIQVFSMDGTAEKIVPLTAAPERQEALA